MANFEGLASFTINGIIEPKQHEQTGKPAGSSFHDIGNIIVPSSPFTQY